MKVKWGRLSALLKNKTKGVPFFVCYTTDFAVYSNQLGNRGQNSLKPQLMHSCHSYLGCDSQRRLASWKRNRTRLVAAPVLQQGAKFRNICLGNRTKRYLRKLFILYHMKSPQFRESVSFIFFWCHFLGGETNGTLERISRLIQKGRRPLPISTEVPSLSSISHFTTIVNPNIFFLRLLLRPHCMTIIS